MIGPAPAQSTAAWKSAALPIGWLALHVPLAYAVHASSLIATIHACVVLLSGLLIVSAPRQTERIAYIAAYIAGSELLWRMGKSSLFWETGKYSITLFLGLAILRSGRGRGSVLPILYFVLLVPSTVYLLTSQGISEARGDISFNLSGPLALMVSVWFFSRLTLTLEEVRGIWLAMLGPIIGVGFLAVMGIAQSEDFHIAANSASNFAASAGYGPNQVSAFLGLGALLALLYLMSGQGDRLVKVFMGFLIVWLIAQSAMTFSRGGLYNLAIAAAPAILFGIRDARLRMRLIAIAVPAYVVTAFVLVPALDDFTEGGLTRRFNDTRLTGRAEIAQGDLDLWQANLILGVGPGQSPKVRDNHVGIVAHTEYTRLLAEHGVFGCIAIGVLMMMAMTAIWRARTTEGRAIAAACVVWALVFMTHAGMRLASPSLVFGLALATLSGTRTESSRSSPSMAPQEYWPI